MRENMEVGGFWYFYEAILLLQLDTETKSHHCKVQTMIQVSIYIYISARKMDRLSKLEKKRKMLSKVNTNFLKIGF